MTNKAESHLDGYHNYDNNSEDLESQTSNSSTDEQQLLHINNNNNNNNTAITMGKIDAKKERYPYCVVWTPIPILTWLFPFVGHMGIANSEGIIYDFAAPYHIAVDNFAFGSPTKYLQLDPKKMKNKDKTWDQCIEKCKGTYCRTSYNFFINNCHNYVQTCLNEMEYEGDKNWSVIQLGGRMFFQGSHVSTGAILKTYLPFFLILLCFLFLFVGLPSIIATSL